MKQSKKRMGVDLDGVVYQFIEQFDELVKRRGYSVDRTSYDRGLPLKTLIPLLDENKANGALRTLPEYNNAVATLNKLSNNYDLYLITARTNSFNGHEDTLARVNESGINYKELIFSRNKGKEAKRLNLTSFIEDSYSNALGIVKNSNTKVFLLDTEYNQVKYDAKGIHRINDLEEVV